MDLESLKAAYEAALAASQADASNKALEKTAAEAKKAYDDAVTAAEKAKGQGSGDPNLDEFDETKADEKTKAYLAKLRKENAGHRTKAKELASKLTESEERKKAMLKAAGIEVETEDPAELLEVARAGNEQLAFRSAILESALQNGIGKDDFEFYEFCVAKAVGELQEGDELTDEQMAEIVKRVKTKSAGAAANSSVGAGGGGNRNPAANDTTVTLEKFLRMNITEKSALYEKNLDLYKELMAQAKAQRKLI